MTIPVVITVYADRSFTFITKNTSRRRSSSKGMRD
jgi:ribosomal protein L11